MIYVDTSALLKRYIAEAQSDAFDAFLAERAPVSISRLTVTEFRCALARRRRAGQIDTKLERAAQAQLGIDLQDGVIVAHPVSDGQVAAATHLFDRLRALPLRTLDALHLCIAEDWSCSGYATADKVQAESARALGFDTHCFF